RLEQCCFRKRNTRRQTIHNARRHDNIFGEGARASIVSARNSNDLAVVAEVQLSSFTKFASAAGDGGIESYAFVLGQVHDVSAECRDRSRCFVPHHNWRNAPTGGAIVAVDIASTN